MKVPTGFETATRNY